jgi:hypothetical protein
MRVDETTGETSMQNWKTIGVVLAIGLPAAVAAPAALAEPIFLVCDIESPVGFGQPHLTIDKERRAVIKYYYGTSYEVQFSIEVLRFDEAALEFTYKSDRGTTGHFRLLPDGKYEDENNHFIDKGQQVAVWGRCKKVDKLF